MEIENALQMKQKIKNIENNLVFIKDNLPKINENPIFIELAGTPKSGKTTLANAINEMFKSKEINFQIRQTNTELNPIKNISSEEYNIWTLASIVRNLSEDLANQEPRIVLYDGGIISCIPWLDNSVVNGSVSIHDEKILNSFFDTDFMEGYNPLLYNFFMSPKISIGRKGKDVDLENIKSYNRFLLQEQNEIQLHSQRYHFVETDHYDGNIKEFIIDMANIITQDVRERIREEINYSKKLTDDIDSDDLDYA